MTEWQLLLIKSCSGLLAQKSGDRWENSHLGPSWHLSAPVFWPSSAPPPLECLKLQISTASRAGARHRTSPRLTTTHSITHRQCQVYLKATQNGCPEARGGKLDLWCHRSHFLPWWPGSLKSSTAPVLPVKQEIKQQHCEWLLSLPVCDRTEEHIVLIPLILY